MFLLNPGPVTLTPRVRNALLGEDLCHREPEFSELQSEIRSKIVEVYGETDYDSVLVTGSGTAAVEMMVGSLIPRSGKALVVANGVYGERMAAMLKQQGKNFELIKGDWLESISLPDVEKKLKEDSALTHVISVHHETTTGRLNPIKELGSLCKKYQKSFLLDAVSSFGGEEIRLQEWGIDACAATANKCLHGVPGISFVIAKKSVLESFETGSTSIYLDLKLQYLEQKKGSSPFTHSVQCCYALREALCEFQEMGGWETRRKRYLEISRRLRDHLQSLGVQILLENQNDYSSTLTSYRLPTSSKYQSLHDHLKENNFIIYAGQGRFSGEIFRIAVMGDLKDETIDKLINCFNTYFTKR